MRALPILAVVLLLAGCATTLQQEFTELSTDPNSGEVYENTFRQKAKAGPFAQQSVELQELDWKYGEGQSLVVGQKGQQDNSGQVEAIGASAAVVNSLAESVLSQLGPPPVGDASALPAWMTFALSLVGGDQGILQQVIARILGGA